MLCFPMLKELKKKNDYSIRIQLVALGCWFGVLGSLKKNLKKILLGFVSMTFLCFEYIRRIYVFFSALKQIQQIAVICFLYIFIYLNIFTLMSLFNALPSTFSLTTLSILSSCLQNKIKNKKKIVD